MPATIDSVILGGISSSDVQRRIEDAHVRSSTHPIVQLQPQHDLPEDLASAPPSQPHQKNQTTRRDWISRAAITAGAVFCGCELFSCLRTEPTSQDISLVGAVKLGLIDFVGEGSSPTNTPLRTELDGRLLTDLSEIASIDSTIPTEKFYVRTRASQLLDLTKPWVIRHDKALNAPKIEVAQLRHHAVAQGIHVMECAGNARGKHFGLLSAAEWSGVSVSALLEPSNIPTNFKYLLISGFDTYAGPSADSIPGASWIFSLDSLLSAGAFLATKMNGESLTPDHGSPVRLVVPGWYGCCCIKWVNEIAVAGVNAEATSQMREYASRTGQDRVPDLAADYQQATTEPAALPIRVEKWLVHGRLIYRVVGITWGGMQPIKDLRIRFGPDENYQRVENLQEKKGDSWGYWTHLWMPSRPGTYLIRLLLANVASRTRRLDSGYYARTVSITEV